MPQRYVSHDPQLERCLNSLRRGFRDGVSYEDLYQRLIGSDEYLLLADYRAYCDAERRMAETYENREQWNCMSLLNIARSGSFAADRAVAGICRQHLARSPQIIRFDPLSAPPFWAALIFFTPSAFGVSAKGKVIR